MIFVPFAASYPARCRNTAASWVWPSCGRLRVLSKPDPAVSSAFWSPRCPGCSWCWRFARYCCSPCPSDDRTIRRRCPQLSWVGGPLDRTAERILQKMKNYVRNGVRFMSKLLDLCIRAKMGENKRKLKIKVHFTLHENSIARSMFHNMQNS